MYCFPCMTQSFDVFSASIRPNRFRARLLTANLVSIRIADHMERGRYGLNVAIKVFAKLNLLEVSDEEEERVIEI